MNEEVQGYINQLEQDNQDKQAQNNELRQAVSSQNQDNNLIEFQLDTKEIIEKIEHYLKGEVISYDAEGNEFWQEPEDPELIIFNQHGVSTIMRTIQQYITKETKLSNYKEERIYEILADLGDALRIYLLCNYERMGLDTEYKKSQYPLIVITLINMIETSYRNSIDALTLKESNTGRNIVQTEGRGGFNQGMVQQKRRGFNIFGFGG